MASSFTIGRVRGIELGINWSWLIVFGLIVWSLAGAVFPSAQPGLGSGVYIAMGAIGAVAFFTSLLLHEMGHAVVAQREGMTIQGITLWVFGGVARFRGMFPSAGAEFRIAIAGPLVSLAIGAVCLGATAIPGLPDSVDAVIGWLGAINLILVAFNMLPALPLDGGRVLRSVLWARSGDFTVATRRAAGLGEGIGRVMIGGGLALAVLGGPGGLWLALIGWFVLTAARAEMALGIAYELLAGMRVRDAMVVHPVAVPAQTTLDEFLRDVFARTHFAAYPVVDDGDTVGLIAVGDVLAVSRAALPRRTAGEVMVRRADAVAVQQDTPLADAATELLGTSLGRGLVVDGSRVVGLLSLTDIEHEVEQREAAAGGRQFRAITNGQPRSGPGGDGRPPGYGAPTTRAKD